MLILTPVSVEVTSQSWFCNSCHIMNSYYTSWKVGSHKDVECVQCHIAPGVMNFVSAKLNGLGQVVDDVLERTSGKPSASVSDFACTRSGCHEMGKIRATVKREGKYLFDHGKHIGLDYQGISVNCTTCHSHVKGNKHFEVNTSICVTCHLTNPAPAVAPKVNLVAGPASGFVQPVALTAVGAVSADQSPAGVKVPPSRCNACHKAPEKTIEYNGLKVVHAEYLVYGAACESCHRGVTAKVQKISSQECFACHDYGMEKFTNQADMHRVHSSGKHKVECFSCHGMTSHGPSAQSMRLDQIDCQACHQDQHRIQQSTYKMAGVPAHQPTTAPAVTPMFMAHVDCTGCHIQPRALNVKPLSGATVAAASPRACDACHKPGLGEQMIPLWQKNTHELYDSVALLLPPAERSALCEADHRNVAEARQLLDLVRLDGSWGVHNPKYTEALLHDARQKLNAVVTPPRQPAIGTPATNPSARSDGGMP